MKETSHKKKKKCVTPLYGVPWVVKLTDSRMEVVRDSGEDSGGRDSAWENKSSGDSCTSLWEYLTLLSYIYIKLQQ
jgi:hypothetical protein